MQHDVQRQGVGSQDLRLDPGHLPGHRRRGQHAPDDPRQDADSDQRAVQVDAIAAPDPLVGLQTRVAERGDLIAKTPLLEDRLRGREALGGHEQVAVIVGAQGAVGIQPGRDRRALEEDAVDLALVQRGDHLGGDLIDQQRVERQEDVQ